MPIEDGGRLDGWYRRTFGEPLTETDPLGYGVFVLGTVLLAGGIALMLIAGAGSTLHGFAMASGAGGVALLLLGQVIALPVSETATWLAGAGVVVCAGSIVLFFTVYPGAWGANGNAGVLLTYLAGVVLILLSGVGLPMLESDEESSEAVEPEGREDPAEGEGAAGD